MKCPNDNATLVMTDRSGIEIDYCPECRGVWLDRGELDKIIERSGALAQPTMPPSPQQAPPQHRDHYPEQRYANDDYHKGHHKKRKKDGFLGDLFDF